MSDNNHKFPFQGALLCNSDLSQSPVTVVVCRCAEEHQDLQEAFKRAARAFLETEEGKAMFEEYHGYFNYMDATKHVPARFFEAEGIQIDTSFTLKNMHMVDISDHLGPARTRPQTIY